MAHVLCSNTGLTGIHRASLELVTRLQGGGHRVTLASPRDVAAHEVPSSIEIVRIPGVRLSPAPQVERESSRALRKVTELRTARARRSMGVGRLGMESFAALLGERRPDLVLLDLELHEHITTALALGFRVALISPFFGFDRRRGLPPLDSSIVPGRGLRGTKLGIEWAWARARARQRLRSFRTWTRYFGTDRRGVLSEQMRREGVPRGVVRRSDWQALFSYRHVPLLSMTAREMDFPHGPAPEFTYVGPMVHRGVERATADREAQAVERVLQDARTARRRLVHASLSTMAGASAEWLDALFHVARRRRDLSFVVGLGDRAQHERDLPGIGGAAPSNAHVFRWIPQLDVLARASCSIHGGGIHTAHECVELRVPQVVVPGRRFDQDGNAARIESHGLGMRIAGPRATPDELERAIERALTNSTMSEQIRAMANAFESYRRDDVLLHAVDACLGAAPLISRARPSSGPSYGRSNSGSSQ